MNLGINFIVFLLYIAHVGTTETKPTKLSTEPSKGKTTVNKHSKKAHHAFAIKPQAYTRGIGPAISQNSTRADVLKVKSSTGSSITNGNKETTTAKYETAFPGPNSQLTASNLNSNTNGNSASANIAPVDLTPTLMSVDSNLRTEPAAVMQDTGYTGGTSATKNQNYWPYFSASHSDPVARPPVGFMASNYQQYQPLPNNLNAMDTEPNGLQDTRNEVTPFTKVVTSFPKLGSGVVVNATGFVPVITDGKESQSDGRPVDRFGQALVTTDMYAAIDQSVAQLLAEPLSSLSSSANEWVAMDIDGTNGGVSVTEPRSTVDPTAGLAYITSQRDNNGVPLYGGLSSFADDASNTLRVEVPIANYYATQAVPAQSNRIAYQGNYMYKGNPQIGSSASIAADNEYKGSSGPPSIAYGRENLGASPYIQQDVLPVTKSVSDYGVIGHRPLSSIESFAGQHGMSAYSGSQLGSFDSALERHALQRTARSSTGDMPEEILGESSPRSSDINELLARRRLGNVEAIMNSIHRTPIHRRSIKTSNNKD